ncbi:MAG: bile acid:sodium symporter [Formivibrio sp.]|nr:bile acid:sodium symporter [Formivibrio sp.]
MSVARVPQWLKAFLSRLSKEWFLVGMIGAVVLASLFPELGRTGGILHGDKFADIGIAIVFFLHGLGISFQNLKDGLSCWKVHVFVQISTFAVFPLIWVVTYALVGKWLPSGLALGFCYLCALPSTVSSSVAMTGLARGNVPAAIFNATLSGLLGIVLTPLLVAAFAGGEGHSLPLLDTVLGIAKLLLLPLVIGQLLRPLLHQWHNRNKRYTNRVDRWVILMLVYTAFSDSVASGLWRNNGIGTLALTFVGAALILVLVLALSTWLARRLGFTVEDEIAAVFCGSKKTMASGVPMAKLLFGANPSLGLILLPIMLYHQLQLFVCSILANRYAKRAT